MNLRITCSAFILLSGILSSGCNYSNNRLHDFMDPWTAGVECAQFPCLFLAKASVLQVGFGIVGEREKDEPPFGLPPRGAGFIGRNGLCTYKITEVWLFMMGVSELDAINGHNSERHKWSRKTYSAIFLDSRIWNGLGIDLPVFGQSTIDGPIKWNSDAFEFEAAAGIIGGARVGFNPIELLDFLFGFTTLDIAGDDVEETKNILKPSSDNAHP